MNCFLFSIDFSQKIITALIDLSISLFHSHTFIVLSLKGRVNLSRIWTWNIEDCSYKNWGACALYEQLCQSIQSITFYHLLVSVFRLEHCLEGFNRTNWPQSLFFLSLVFIVLVPYTELLSYRHMNKPTLVKPLVYIKHMNTQLYRHTFM